jgi:hypothetical protein
MFLHELGIFRSLVSTKEIAMGFFNVKLLFFKQIEVFESFGQNMNKSFQILVSNIQRIDCMTRVITNLKHCHLVTDYKLALLMKNWPYDPQSSCVASSKFKLIREYVNIESITFEKNEELIINFGFFEEN